MRRACTVGVAAACTLSLFVADTLGRRIRTLSIAPAEPGRAMIRDTRPPGPNGYLCIHGAKGRLNNLILQNLVGVHMAHHVNRTLLVDDEVAEYYDVDALSLGAFPDAPFRVAAPLGGSNVTCPDPKGEYEYSIDRGLTIEGRFEQFEEQAQRRPQPGVAVVDNSDVWYWLGRPPEDVYGRFFRGLVLRDVYRGKVEEFLGRHGLRDDSFNAVHLRFFEGKCGQFETHLCCPKLGHVQELIEEGGGSLLSPLFVANDRQCPVEVLRRTRTRPTRSSWGTTGRATGPSARSWTSSSACGAGPSSGTSRARAT